MHNSPHPPDTYSHHLLAECRERNPNYLSAYGAKKTFEELFAS
jgi:hypothetical protein